MQIFDIGIVEIGDVHFSHDTSPALFGIEKATFVVDIFGIDIIGTVFLGIVREVEHLHDRGFSVIELLVGKYLGVFDFAYVMVRQLFEVVFDMCRGSGGISLRENPVDVVPCQ